MFLFLKFLCDFRLSLGELFERYIRRAAAVLLYEAVDHELEGGPQHAVYQQDEGQIDAVGEECVHHYEEEVGDENGDEHELCLHSGADQLVVDVILVRKKRAAAFTYPVERHPHNVEHRHKQRAESHYHIHCVLPAGRAEAEMYHEIAEDVAEGKAACVAHEELVAFPFVSEHIVEPEHHHDAEGDQRHGRVDVFLFHHEHAGQYA